MTIRETLEELKTLDDARREADGGSDDDAMLLFRPATAAAIKKLVQGGWNHPLPNSYGEFLAASDGVTRFLGELEILGTDAERQEQIQTIIKERVEADETDLRALFKKMDAAAIEKWEAKEDRIYAPNHAVVGVSQFGGLLFYDSRTRDANGEMTLCWISDTDAEIAERYKNIRAYLEAKLKDAREAAE